MGAFVTLVFGEEKKRISKNFLNEIPPTPFFVIFICMEKVISKIVKYILEKKYPVFTDVEVTSERNYVDKKKSIKYNIFLTIDYSDFEPIRISGDWDILKSEIRDVVKMSGIDNYVNVYLNFSDEE